MRRTALLVVDMQEALVEAVYGRNKVLAKIDTLLERARAAGAPIIYTQHDHASYEPMTPDSPGWYIHQEIAPLTSELVVHKRSADPFHETNLEAELRLRGVEQVVVTG